MNLKSFLKSVSEKELKDLLNLIPAELKSRRTTSPVGDGALVTFTDGASRGNPGHAGVGVMIYNDKEEVIKEDFKYLGICTNNEAEYRALLLALDHAENLSEGDVRCFLDSELTVRQLNGQYAIKSEKLLPFHEEVRRRMKNFKSVSFTHVPREHPKLQLVDKLANKAIDQAKI